MSMKPIVINIEDIAEGNNFFRDEVVTGEHSQVMVMSLEPGEDIGEEVHDVDQTLIFVKGTGTSTMDDKEYTIKPGTLAFVPAGTKHNFVNTGKEKLKLFTMYAPVEHVPGTVHPTKKDAETDPNEQD